MPKTDCLWRRVAIAAAFGALLLLGVACSQSIEYIVQPGDTLQTIALGHHTTVTDIVQLNQKRYPELAKNPPTLKPGIVLQVPAQSSVGSAFEALVDKAIAEWEKRASGVEGATPTQAGTPAVTKEQMINLQAWQLVNEARSKNGLSPLSKEATLSKIAQARSDDMIARSYFSHNDPATGKVAFEELIKSYHYAYLVAGENIAEIKNEGAFVPSPLAVFNHYSPGELAQQFATGWLNSPEHRDNIMNSRFHRTGVAIATNIEKTRVIATQVFSD